MSIGSIVSQAAKVAQEYVQAHLHAADPPASQQNAPAQDTAADTPAAPPDGTPVARGSSLPPNSAIPASIALQLMPGGAAAGAAVGAAAATGAGAGGVSAEQLQAIMPNLSREKAQEYLPFINSAMAKAHIDTPERQAAFLAQLAHESGGLQYMEEIASGAAYEGRTDLGNTQPGDGERFKGRGPIQLTGRANYKEAGDALGIDLVNNPTRAADPDVGFRLATWFWDKKGLNELADKGDFLGITQAINGGTNGLTDRQEYYARAREALGAA